MEAKSTPKLKVEKLKVVVDSFDADSVKTRSPAMEDRTYVSGKMLRSATAMAVTNLRRSVVEGKVDFEKPGLGLTSKGRLESNAR